LTKQNRRKATRQRTETITARPTNTVEALKAGAKIEAKLSSLPTQRTVSVASVTAMILAASVGAPIK